MTIYNRNLYKRKIYWRKIRKLIDSLTNMTMVAISSDLEHKTEFMLFKSTLSPVSHFDVRAIDGKLHGLPTLEELKMCVQAVLIPSGRYICLKQGPFTNYETDDAEIYLVTVERTGHVIINTCMSLAKNIEYTNIIRSITDTKFFHVHRYTILQEKLKQQETKN